MSFIKAKEYLKKFNLEDRIMEFDVSSATVIKAAEAIGCSTNEIAKTLAFLLGENPIIIVVSGNVKIDNSKYKKEFLTKVKMIPFELVEEYIGHKVGGVCPFGINSGVKIYLDDSLKSLTNIYPACGSSNSAVKLSLEELEKIIPYEKWVDVSK